MNAARKQKRSGESSTGKRVLITVIIAVVLLGGLGAAAAAVLGPFGDKISLALGWTSNDYEGEGHGQTVIVIKKGEIGEDVAASLAKAGVVKTSEAFYKILLAQNPAVNFTPGTYKVKLEMSSKSALAALQDPANRMQYTAMIPEGKTVAQTLELVSAGADIPLKDLQAAAKNVAAYDLPKGVDSLEGWLFPATYEFEQDTTGEQAIAHLVDTQKKVLDEAGVPVEQREEVLTKASIVQREGGRVEDFAKVARVIDNRLADGMKLQMDSTAQYGMGQHADGNVWSTDAALADKNPWNTYVHTGLPKGPIANPGRDAIDAVVHPADGNWVYFVAINLDTGESAFSATQEEHDANVAKLNAWCEANPGKGC